MENTTGDVARLTALADHALAVLNRMGCDHAEVRIGTGSELEVSVREGEVELVKEARSSGLSVRVIRNERVGTSSTTDLQEAAVEAFLRRTVEMADLAEPDPLAVPPAREELAQTWPELALFDAKTDKIGAGQAIEAALEAEKAAFAHDTRITSSDGASFSRSSGRSVLATSGGFVGAQSGTYQSLAVQAVADDDGGKKRGGHDWTGGRFFEDLERAPNVGREAARRAVATLGAAQMPTGVYPVVFDKDAGRAIVGLLAACVLGDAIYRQRSYLGQRLGEHIASSIVHIVDDPSIVRGSGSRAFDGEGRLARANDVVVDGQLKTFLLDTYSARKLGMAPTGSAGGGGGIPHSATSNFYLKAGQGPPEALLEGIEDGLYVTRMMGFGFDPTTGNFSRGAEGFRIQRGELTTPVGEITISRNLGEILLGIERIANDLEHKTSVASPSFRVDQMTVAGA